MKPYISCLFGTVLSVITLQAVGQDALNITQLGHLTYQESLSEVRGALHNGREYALVGVNSGLSIVDVQDPTDPTEVFFESGPGSIWRDPFYHNGYAYCVTEGGGGLLMVDMGPLPGNTNLTATYYTGDNIQWSSAHNMFIDGPNNKAYIFGTNTIQGTIILDISNPAAPVELGTWNQHYIHDGFVRGDTLWASCLEQGTFVVDVSNPVNPVVLTSWDTPSQFGHNVWPSDDNAFCFTTDEVESGFVAAYDMADYQNVVEVDKVQHPLSENVIPHNTHYIDGYLVTSHYRDGVTIHDVSDPSNMVLTGYFDTSPFSGGGFNGAWGAWPFLPSGNLLVSDIEQGLFVLGPTYKRAARLEGTVTEFGTGTPLSGVDVEIAAINIAETTDLFGNYATGTEAAGQYTITFLKGGYIPMTVTDVQLINGQVTLVNVELIPEVSFSFGGAVTEQGTGNPIEGAEVHFSNHFFNLNYTSGPDGSYLDTAFFAGQYDVTVSAWGYVTECTSVDVTESSPAVSFELEKGYYDDFATDLGWSVNSTATAGIWERSIPVGTSFNGTESNPGEDVEDDCDEYAFITGNAGGNAGADDVDDGVTVLLSPLMDLTAYTSPTVQFYYWFFNAGGSSTPNDSYKVWISNGTEDVLLASLPQTDGEWLMQAYPLNGLLPLTDAMQLRVEVEDAAPGHLVEGGLDLFRVVEGTGINGRMADVTSSIYPNPSNGRITVHVPGIEGSALFQVHDPVGALVWQQQLTSEFEIVNLPAAAGVYICSITMNGGRHSYRLVVQ